MKIRSAVTSDLDFRKRSAQSEVKAPQLRWATTRNSDSGSGCLRATDAHFVLISR